ncbi:mannose/fructose/sorbose PTS transporter subunit IIB [Enterococcus dongliensis]|uniref:Mannose/fructose/sorbose PTS transporter subunit IIB n=1 Tax=Enterococcus dongliensis TaxID=2559925 RepID=A0AAP5NK88_9ENTE|nr:mannose/fructose/sorbose PTS transporter subunit IIB [Enterococcus dongliensis]MDT2595534.1 mannose/fructose/sorbose PTS transporter subunit IIB [Enterococcus dongliensis]MDT2603250.1 mannose/fructose/sorbose PTS transporter subunit IIB [Enterococcus dongliensis]MDT2613196.1 mannose/fructose/sorbose PTS transporter subunit IIB [Enterococcus dongliensis]MDT2633613.1 mannose/fructose/sorbose PTS transporter subunit IIB [Enterococcus dongliensis]MDT2636013.1 mannose/fructose/sorbose PTS transp
MVMDIRLTRIDDRLIHGQVATVWSKATGIERILVVSDEVANDELRKFLLKQAAPPGIKSNVVTKRKLIEVYQDQLFDGMKIMLLFASPQDVVDVVEAGVDLQTINIGGMRFSEGKKMITNFISVDGKDIQSFLRLAEAGIELEIRQVPTDRKTDLIQLIKKEKMLQ